MPTFFSERPEDTLAELKRSPEWAFPVPASSGFKTPGERTAHKVKLPNRNSAQNIVMER